MHKLKDLINQGRNALSVCYERHEAENVLKMVFSSALSLDSKDLIMKADADLSDEEYRKIAGIFGELETGKPVQQVLHEAWFMDMKFYVDKNVLIPRPETEELVLWILERFPAMDHSQINFLDIGTGSACIPVSISKLRPSWNIYALDVSGPALEVAQKNALSHNVAINFSLLDILACDKTALLSLLNPSESNNENLFDIIVSNPPYVKDSEMSSMHVRVKSFEPHIALFVPDEDPLVFYREIALKSSQVLKSGGSLFLELNEALSAQLSDLLLSFGYKDVEVRKDFFGKDRMISAVYTH
ncbi:MAG: peptide chain release factor N(5)-glutamine methyltransferase [Bacteroidetes bacterium]|nr:MAG: peptide chain release factor N(5)-glutamine methyltransferase [Bacteroidota bacterium]REK07041.1 MAG: peptide chain release factor N(5)-glutamine methyltransferase [Bacteroidota bacterium]REK33612.1 MAG: peptide chain release factor N(5)-glutamine methyltransferase [Bacteroidota bacterium]REK48597.1 MAG: peptide chain release factor N(5)-glutamine methyltransferase [Bacteroidota bacterium]